MCTLVDQGSLGAYGEVRMVKYIGSKRALLPWILEAVERIGALDRVRSVADPFSGSARVAHALKGRGYFVTASDLNTYAHVLAKALVEADARRYPQEKVEPLLRELAVLPPREGWFSRTYAHEARYFQPKNAARIEAIRQAIEERHGDDPTLKAILLTSLLLAADRVDSTTGVQMAYLKRWAPRAERDLVLAYPPLLPGPGRALLGDALRLVGEVEADLFYLDPPYNQHSYLANYHLWETLVLWDAPPTYGVARKRVDVRWRKSPFNSKAQALGALEALLSRIRAPHLLLSFSDEGFLRIQDIEELLRGWGYVAVLSRPHRRYIGAVIGVHNPKGEKVGRVSHTTNHEYLFVATQRRRVYEAFRELSGQDGQPSGGAGG